VRERKRLGKKHYAGLHKQDDQWGEGRKDLYLKNWKVSECPAAAGRSYLLISEINHPTIFAEKRLGEKPEAAGSACFSTHLGRRSLKKGAKVGESAWSQCAPIDHIETKAPCIENQNERNGIRKGGTKRADLIEKKKGLPKRKSTWGSSRAGPGPHRAEKRGGAEIPTKRRSEKLQPDGRISQE